MPHRDTDDLAMTTDSDIVPRCALVLACIVLVSFAPPASAYLDPGTGSMILSAIVGLFATAALAIKTYWYKIKRMITGKGSDAERRVDEPAQPDPAAEDQE